jgi:hypothetical protein
MTCDNINIKIASKNISATSISRIHSIKPPKTLLANNMPLTIYIRKGSENEFESTVKYFKLNDIKVNIISNFSKYVKKAYANTIFNNMDEYYETIDLLVVAGLTIEKSNKSYIFASIGFRSVKDFTFLKKFNWYDYITSFFRTNITTIDDEIVYKLHKSNIVSYNNINTTKIYEIVLCATINNQLKYMKRIAFKSLEKIIDLFFDDNSKKTIIVLKSTDQGVASNIYSNVNFKMTTITTEGLMFMYRQNTNKPNILDSSFINPIIINK